MGKASVWMELGFNYMTYHDFGRRHVYLVDSGVAALAL